MKSICEICKNNFESKYKNKTCSKKCLKIYKSTDKYKNNFKQKVIQTCLDRYGVSNPAKTELSKEKSRNTNLERYGTISPSLNPIIKKKQTQTNLKKYGVECIFQSKNFKCKFKKTKLNRYGDENFLNLNKIKKTKLDRYGNENYNNFEKTKKTNLEKYGVEYVSKLNNIKEKIKQTNFKKYGVEYINQNEKIKNKIKQTCLSKYGVDNPLKSVNIKEKIKQTNFKKYGVEYSWQNEKIRNKIKSNFFKNQYKNIINNPKFKNFNCLFNENGYNGSTSFQKKYPFQCKICNIKFNDTLCSGHIPRCPKCNPNNKSICENDIFEYVQSILPNEIINKNIKTIIPPLELDVYIPSKKLAIEFNGLYWHSEIEGKKNKIYHLNKTNRCEKQGIRLIHIFEDEWVLNKEIVKNKIKHILGLNSENFIFARKCIINHINFNIGSNFIMENDIQQIHKSSINLGLFYINKLISVMSFKELKNEYYILTNFCNINQNRVIGSASKLLSFFIKTHNPVKIISYIDKRWSNKNCFLNKMGFVYIKNTSPNYWYIINSSQRFSNFSFRKSQLSKKLDKFDSNLTEWENMKQNGWDRIWDCGSLKYEWNSK
jgi:hypothetical protein